MWSSAHLNNEMDRSIERALGRQRVSDLTAVAVRCLIAISAMPGAHSTLVQLEAAAGRSVRNSIAVLTRHGYLTSASSGFDKRATILQLTPKGTAIVPALLIQLADPSDRLLDRVQAVLAAGHALVDQTTAAPAPLVD